MVKTDVPKLNLSDESVEQEPESKDKTEKSAATRKMATARPSTLKLILDAINHQNEKNGSTVQGIRKYIEATHGFQPNNVVLKKAFDKGLKDGAIVRKDGKDAASLTGRYATSKANKEKVKKSSKPKADKDKESKSSKSKALKETETPEGEEAAVRKKEKSVGKAKEPTKEKKANKMAASEAKGESPKKVTKKSGPKVEVATTKKDSGSKKTEGATKKASGPRKKVANKGTGSASDTEVVQSTSAKPKATVAAVSSRRRSKSESEAEAKPAGKAPKSAQPKNAAANKRALRV